MEQYISKSALVAEIKELSSAIKIQLDYKKGDAFWIAQKLLLERLKGKINSLEVKEVDLEEEIKEVQRDYKTIEEYEGCPCTMYADGIEWIARYFFELGLKTK